MKLNYKRKDLIKIIKARKKKDYEFLFNESIELLSCLIRKFQDQKNFDFDECYADFLDCSTSNDHIH